jgi:hypothetical protein
VQLDEIGVAEQFGQLVAERQDLGHHRPLVSAARVMVSQYIS